MPADKDFESLRKTAEKQAQMDLTIRQARTPGEKVTTKEIRENTVIDRESDELPKKRRRAA